MTYTITGHKAALITVLCDEDLEPHHTEIGRMLIKAFRDENNPVYWPLPDCSPTCFTMYAKQAGPCQAIKSVPNL